MYQETSFMLFIFIKLPFKINNLLCRLFFVNKYHHFELLIAQCEELCPINHCLLINTGVVLAQTFAV